MEIIHRNNLDPSTGTRQRNREMGEMPAPGASSKVKQQGNSCQRLDCQCEVFSCTQLHCKIVGFLCCVMWYDTICAFGVIAFIYCAIVNFLTLLMDSASRHPDNYRNRRRHDIWISSLVLIGAGPAGALINYKQCHDRSAAHLVSFEEEFFSLAFLSVIVQQACVATLCAFTAIVSALSLVTSGK